MSDTKIRKLWDVWVGARADYGIIRRRATRRGVTWLRANSIFLYLFSSTINIAINKLISITSII